jgi:hypothetical protein
LTKSLILPSLTILYLIETDPQGEQQLSSKYWEAGLSFFSSKNNSPNKASPCKVWTSQGKSGGKRKSPSQGKGDVVIQNANNRGWTIIAILMGEKSKRT